MEILVFSAAVAIGSGLGGLVVGRRSAGFQPLLGSRRLLPTIAPHGPERRVGRDAVKAALADLRVPGSCQSQATNRRVPAFAGSHAEQRELLARLVVEIAASPDPRDAESGRLMRDYYLMRVGSHEIVMERLHLTRPTFYRRLHRGLALVAERLDEHSLQTAADTSRCVLAADRKSVGTVPLPSFERRWSPQPWGAVGE